MNLKKIRKEHEGKDGWSRWVQPVRRGYVLVCCDCGLAHKMDFRVAEGRVQFKAKRAPGYTRAIRARRKR